MTTMDDFISLELMPMLGDFANDFDVDAIADEVTDFDAVRGVVWREDIDAEYETNGCSETLNSILQKHDKSAMQ